MIGIVIQIENGTAKVDVNLQKANNADLQAAICNLEMIKINMLKNLISMSEGRVTNGDDNDDEPLLN